ncbi:MAG: PEPxxWA-CTERM sorting domain-containing protein [Thiobacillaceae bacterium]|jgi:hypothetical protein|nr:PEPxxWA-CTERM sorting domain-containing protein [Thiobacillaceae bacterium]
MPHVQRSPLSRAAFLALTAACATPAWSAPVTVGGGFTSYTGVAWEKQFAGGSSVTTRFSTDQGQPITLAPTQVLPNDPNNYLIGQGIGGGQLDLTTPNGSTPVPSAEVEFWLSFDGDKSGVNAIRFTPGPAADVGVGDEFLLGTFTLANGGWFGTWPVPGGNYVFPDSAFGFRLTTQSGDGSLDGHVFSGTLRYHVTGTTSLDPADDADYFYIKERPDLGFVGAYESYNTPTGSNTGSIELYGKIGSLVPTRFANPQGVVLAGALPTPPIPEPETWAMLLAGLGLVGWAARRRAARTM